MPARDPYHRSTATLACDPLAAAVRLAELAPDEPFVVYERQGTYSFARGALAEITVDHKAVHYRYGDDTQTIPWRERPLDTVARLMRDLPVDGWRAYGTACFELAYAYTDLFDRDEPCALFHLIVPRDEVLLHGDQAQLRSTDTGRLDAFAEALSSADRGPRRSVTPAQTPDLGDPAGRYLAAVADAVDAIRAGELRKVIVSRTVPVAFEVDLAATYLAGRAANNPARSYLLHLGGLRAVGFSPETVAEIEADRRIRTQPLAGTRALPPAPERAAQLRETLLSDEKELYEHAVSVKLAHDELVPLCEPGSVQVCEYMAVKERGSVQHLGSTVAGTLRDAVDPWGAFAAVFPAVTASGVPKSAAYRLIRRLEPAVRGLYAGAVFTAGHDGSLDAALALRTLFQQGGRTWLQAGAGIVAASRPERELEETREKLTSIAAHLVALVRP